MEALEGGGRTQPQTAVELYVTSVCACVCVCVCHTSLVKHMETVERSEKYIDGQPLAQL